MERRDVLRALGGTGCFLALGGAKWGYTLYARERLAQRLHEDAQSVLVPQAHRELTDLPAEGRDLIETWFITHLSNASEYVYDICSEGFLEKLSACPNETAREQFFCNVCYGKLVSPEEILLRIDSIAEKIGRSLDRRWAETCQQLSTQWGIHIREYGKSSLYQLHAELEPEIRQSMETLIHRSQSATHRPSIGETVESLGKSALLMYSVVRHHQFAVPLFFLAALRPLIAYFSGRSQLQVSGLRTDIWNQLNALGQQTGMKFEEEIKQRITDLHEWQSNAVAQAAERLAHDSVAFLS